MFYYTIFKNLTKGTVLFVRFYKKKAVIRQPSEKINIIKNYEMLSSDSNPVGPKSLMRSLNSGSNVAHFDVSAS